MTWPFGGLPLGGVFLGQADGPLLPLARLGGPLLLTAAVWAGGVGVATFVCGMDRVRVRGAIVLVGLAVLVLIGAVAPAGGPAVRSISVALVQGGGRRGLNQEEVPPAIVFTAQLAANPQVGRHRPSPSLVLWPEDVVALSGTSGRFAARGDHEPDRPAPADHAGGRGDRAGVPDGVSQ